VIVLTGGDFPEQLSIFAGSLGGGEPKAIKLPDGRGGGPIGFPSSTSSDRLYLRGNVAVLALRPMMLSTIDLTTEKETVHDWGVVGSFMDGPWVYYLRNPVPDFDSGTHARQTIVRRALFGDGHVEVLARPTVEFAEASGAMAFSGDARGLFAVISRKVDLGSPRAVVYHWPLPRPADAP